MSLNSEGTNPLRPYYTPPPINSHRITPYYVPDPANAEGKDALLSKTSLGSSARNILADINDSIYVPNSSPSSAEVLKTLVEQALWKYASIFLAQPFEVAKMILQVQVANYDKRKVSRPTKDGNIQRQPEKHRRDQFEIPSDDDESDPDPDSHSYFTPSVSSSHTPSRPARIRRQYGSYEMNGNSRTHTQKSPPSTHYLPHKLELKSSSAILGALSSTWNVEGSWGVWKGTNSTYIHSILFSTITSFVRSFLSAFAGLPDSWLFSPTASTLNYTGGLDILSSPSPLASLTVAVSAAGVAGILLAPLDIARTKLMLTPSTHQPRSILATLKALPRWTLPVSIAPTAILHYSLPTLISASMPLILRSKLGIDPMLTPNLYAIATFFGQAFELGVKLPIETVLRRGQMDIAWPTSEEKEAAAIVEIGPYRGFFGTMYSIIYDEGERGVSIQGARGVSAPRVSNVSQNRRKRKGQGFEGLWRGWRVGMWGLLGVWGAARMGGAGGKTGEF